MPGHVSKDLKGRQGSIEGVCSGHEWRSAVKLSSSVKGLLKKMHLDSLLYLGVVPQGCHIRGGSRQHMAPGIGFVKLRHL